MVRKVITTHPQASVSHVAKQLVDNDISALPVVDDAGRVVGKISEADLMRREELGSEKTRPWWLEAMTPAVTLAEEFARSHGKRLEELMSNHVVTATEDASLNEIASLLEKHHIKRVLRAEIVTVVDGLRRAKRDCREWGGQSLRFSRIA